MSDPTLTPPKGLKYTATRMDIVNDFYDEVQRLFEKYRYQREAVCALDEIESLAVWWANAPAVVRPGEGGPLVVDIDAIRMPGQGPSR
jgi:hypothetical protein